MTPDTEISDNPDWNFIEVQIHGNVDYRQEIEKIVIAASELDGQAPHDAIELIKTVTGVDNVIVV